MAQIERGILSAFKTIGSASAFPKAENNTRSSWSAATLLSIGKHGMPRLLLTSTQLDADGLQSDISGADGHGQRTS